MTQGSSKSQYMGMQNYVVFTPKYRKKALFGPIRKELKDVFHRLATQKNWKIEEGHLMPDHVRESDPRLYPQAGK